MGLAGELLNCSEKIANTHPHSAMSFPWKSQPSRIPFYFAARHRDRTPPRSASEELEAQQNLDMRAEDLTRYSGTGLLGTGTCSDSLTYSCFSLHQIDLAVSLRPSLGSQFLLLLVVFSGSTTLFHRSVPMPVTLGVLQRIVRWRPIERWSEGKSAGYFALGNISANSEVGHFSGIFLIADRHFC